MIPAKYVERAREIQRYTPWYELQREIEALVAEVIKDTEKEYDMRTSESPRTIGCMKKYTMKGEKKW